MQMTEHKKKSYIRYLLYLALVTSVVASVTLAKFAQVENPTARAELAAFVVGARLDLEVPLTDMLAPGDTKTVEFAVTNFDGDNGTDVVMEYKIEVYTTGNLPLEFSLLGEKEADDSDVVNSVLASSLGPDLTASGGRLPITSQGGKKTHTYRLTIHWPEAEDSQAYSGEIDRLVVRVITEQASNKSQA